MQYNQDLSLATLVNVIGNYFVTVSLLLATIGSGNFVILVLDVINLPLCTVHTCASPESIQWYIFQSVVLRSCVTASPLGEEEYTCRTHDRFPLVGATVLSLFTWHSAFLSLLSGLASMFAPPSVFRVDDQVCHICDVPRRNHSQVCFRLASDQCIPRNLQWRCRFVPVMSVADVAIDV